MSIKEIKEKILQDAFEKKDEILKNAVFNIEKIKKQAIEENEIIQKKILEKYNNDAELKEKNIITEARLIAKKEILFEKQSIIDDIFAKVLDKIVNFDDEIYLNFIENIVLNNVETGDESIYIGKRERPLINQKFIDNINNKLKSAGKKGELKLSNNRLPIIGGIVLGKEDIKKNASLEVIIENIKDETVTMLNNFLFSKNRE